MRSTTVIANKVKQSGLVKAGLLRYARNDDPKDFLGSFFSI
jgi:hypothetical protein